MSRRAAYAVAYLALSTGLMYGVWDQDLHLPDSVGMATLVFGVVLHPVLGYAIGRYWALLLPFAVALIAAPAGYPDAYEWEPIPLWAAQMYVGVAEAVLMVPGIVVRKVRDAPSFDERSSESE